MSLVGGTAPQIDRDEHLLPLLPSQRRLRLLHQCLGHPAPAVVRSFPIAEGLEPGEIDAALTALHARHAVLRFRVRRQGADLCWIAACSEAVQSAVLPAGELPGFDLERDGEPLVRWYRAGGSARLMLAHPALLLDARSAALIAAELGQVVVDEPQCERATPDPDGTRWLAVADRLTRAAGRPETEAALLRVRRRLASLPPVVDLPGDRVRPPQPTLRTALERLPLTAVDGEADPESLVLAAILTVLHGHTGQRDLPLALELDLRASWGVAGALGPFTQPVVLPARVHPDRPFEELLDAVREQRAVVSADASLPFELLLDAVGPARDISRAPLAQVAFRRSAWGDEADTEPGAYDLSFELHGSGPDLELRVRYQTDAFSAAAVRRLLGHLGRVLEQAVVDGTRPVCHLDLLTEDERAAAVTRWNATAAELPAHCLHELFARQAVKTPDEPAVISPSETLTYAELARRVHRLAHHLRTAGVGPGSLVGVCLRRTASVPVALLGILEAGGAYLPLDPGYPAERLAFLLADADPTVVVTEAGLASRLPEHPSRKVLLDTRFEERPTKAERSAGVDGDFPIYVIYTSGSTGAPKGVMLDHRGRANNFQDFNSRFAVGTGDRILGISSLSFDMTAYDVLGTLSCGAALVLPEAERERDPAHWAELMVAHGVTLWHSVPALLETLLDYAELRCPEAPAGLRTVLLGGDWIPVGLPDRLRALAPAASVVSLGGATEVSMDSTIYAIDRVDPTWRSIPYGVPMRNQLAYVRDPQGRLCPVGVPGELYLGGVGLAWGYHARAGLSAHRFVPNPWSGTAGGRLYRTGDLAKYGDDGNLILLGRVDFQVKIRGLRIEPGEIEALLREQDGVADALVVAREGTRGEKRLVAYWVAAESEAAAFPSADTLTRALKERLPAAMVPSAFVRLEALPLTPNGKVDRRNLPAPQDSATAAPYAAPAAGVELAIASLMAELLAVDQVGRDDDFFRLGGHSLLGVRLLWKAREALGRDIPLPLLLAHPTPRQLAVALDGVAETGPGGPIGRSVRRQAERAERGNEA